MCHNTDSMRRYNNLFKDKEYVTNDRDSSDYIPSYDELLSIKDDDDYLAYKEGEL